MPSVVIAAVALMLAAFICYSIGVWGSILGRQLQSWHALLFWCGFVLDSAGTEIMRHLAGGFHLSLHTGTGIAALGLMLLHALWATIVLLRGDEARLKGFHRISLTVWLIWLVPFVTGLVIGARRHG
jgi:uncharacterized repeat protein (TIGR03987 family)